MCVREIDKYLPTSFCRINGTEIWNKVPIILMHFVQGFVKYVHLRSLSPCLCPVIHWASLRLSIYPSAVLSMEHSYSWPSKTSLMRAILAHMYFILFHTGFCGMWLQQILLDSEKISSEGSFCLIQSNSRKTWILWLKIVVSNVCRFCSSFMYGYILLPADQV